MPYTKISIIIPVFNEEQTIREVYNKVQTADVLGLAKEIIIVDDCSTDGTREILHTFQNSDTKIIYQNKNQGKGAALVSGFSQATGDIVIIQDADLEYDPAEISKIISPIAAGKTKVVFGSRYLQPENKLKFWHSFFNQAFTNFANIFVGQKLTDIMTCYKAFDKTLLNQIKLTSDRFGFEPEVAIKISRTGNKILEIPISYSPRTRHQGKHMNFKGELETLWALIKYSFSKN